MTDVTSAFGHTGIEREQKSQPLSCHVEGAPWGYTVRTTAGASRGLIIAQTVSMVLGAAFLAGAIGMWLLPALTPSAGAADIRAVATVLFVGLATLLMWYGSRGVLSHIHFDTSRGEIREVARNRAGRISVIGCYGFDSVGGVFMEPTEDGRACHLVLRYRNGGDPLIVATGKEAELTSLREKITRDVVVRSNEVFAAVVAGKA